MTIETINIICKRIEELGIPEPGTDKDLDYVITNWVHQGGCLVVRRLPDGHMRVDLFQKPDKER